MEQGLYSSADDRESRTCVGDERGAAVAYGDSRGEQLCRWSSQSYGRSTSNRHEGWTGGMEQLRQLLLVFPRTHHWIRPRVAMERARMPTRRIIATGTQATRDIGAGSSEWARTESAVIQNKGGVASGTQSRMLASGTQSGWSMQNRGQAT